MREWRYSSTILDIGTRLKWVVSSTAWSLYPSKRHCKYSTYKAFSPFISRSLVAASNGIRSLSCIFRTFQASTTSFSLLTTVNLNWLNRLNCKSKNQNCVTTDGQSASLSSSQAPIWAQDEIFVTVRQLRVFYVGRSLWRKDGSVVYSCSWSSPAQSSDLNPHSILLQHGGPGPNIYIPQEQGGPSCTSRHWVPVLSPPATEELAPARTER
jgi:hypothetical protein